MWYKLVKNQEFDRQTDRQTHTLTLRRDAQERKRVRELSEKHPSFFFTFIGTKSI